MSLRPVASEAARPAAPPSGSRSKLESIYDLEDEIPTEIYKPTRPAHRTRLKSGVVAL
jgi:hypothetical protein